MKAQTYLHYAPIYLYEFQFLLLLFLMLRLLLLPLLLRVFTYYQRTAANNLKRSSCITKKSIAAFQNNNKYSSNIPRKARRVAGKIKKVKIR